MKTSLTVLAFVLCSVAVFAGCFPNGHNGVPPEPMSHTNDSTIA